MPLCKSCGVEVTFAPHPSNPAKQAPFNLDGVIHFATCPTKSKNKQEYENIQHIDCCGDDILYVFLQPTKAGDRLSVLCSCGQKRAISDTEGNRRLINGTWDDVRAFYRKKYPGSPWYQ